MTLTSTRIAFLGLVVLSLAAFALAFPALPPGYQSLVLPGLLVILGLAAVSLKLWERPALGIAAAIILISVPWPPGEEGTEISLTLPDLAAAGVVGIVALRVLVVGDRGRLRSWVLLPLMGIVLAGGLATLAAKDPGTSLAGLVRHTEIFVIIPIATYLSLESRRDLKLILGTVVALGVLQGVVGTYQYFTGTGAEYGDYTNRAVGTFDAYDIMGMARLVAAAMIVGTAAFAAVRDGRRFWALLLIIALSMPLVFSFSRGTWIAVMIGIMAILAIASWKKLAVFVVAAMLTLGVSSVAMDGGPSDIIVDRFTSIFSATSSPDQSVQDRFAMWEAARGMWEDNPLTGVGIKNFAGLRDSYAPLSYSGGSDISDPSAGYRRVELLSPHSLYWLILSEQGLIGAFSYGLFFLSLGVVGFRRLSRLEDSSVEKVFGLACVGFLVSYFVDSIYADLGGSTEVLHAVFFGGLVWLASGATVADENEVEETK